MFKGQIQRLKYHQSELWSSSFHFAREEMRSRTGCQTCRARKLKCDEKRPSCGQCRKASRECIPSAGIVFRHQQNASMNAVEEEIEDGNQGSKLGAFYSYKNTFNDDNIWVEVPKKVTFVHIFDPYMETSPIPESPKAAPTGLQEPQEIVPNTSLPPADETMMEPQNTTPWHAGLRSMEGGHNVGLDALSTVAANDQYLPNTFRASITPVDGRNTMSPATSLSSANNLNFILNPSASSTSPSVDPGLPPLINRRSSSILSHVVFRNSTDVVSEHETAFLLRQFAENTGVWMDLFDLGAYFAQTVPIEAVSNPLLKYAACATAAKQIARIQGSDKAKEAQMAHFPDADKTDWSYQATHFYDLAISLLMKELSFRDEQATDDPRWAAGVENTNIRNFSKCRSDQTLAATAILCVYEFLDNTTEGWSRHLSGTKSLFDLADKEELMPIELQNPSPLISSSFAISQRLRPSQARRSAFWNFARQDFLAAFINETPSRLDTADLGMWRAAGLLLDTQGFVLPSNKHENSHECYFASGERGMREDMIANALIWLLSKIVNYTAAGDSIDHVFPQDRSSPGNGILGINQMTLLERWYELEKELDIWEKGLPKSFEPYARLKHAGPVDSSLQEIWFGMPMTAATMQSYHMARVILLVNRPQESTVRRSTLAERLHSYRTIESQVRYHSIEIIGIALGRPPPTVRVHMVQPLFVAGQCLTGDFERQTIITQLQMIEKDLGWATEYRVQQLLKEWGWEGQEILRTP